MTLRDLVDMAVARQKADWLRVGVSVACIVNRNGWTQTPISPLDVIPEAFRPEVEKVELTEEQRAAESEMAWRQMDRFFSKKR